MKKIELPREAVYRKDGQKFWFIEIFENGNRKHWSYGLYEDAPVERIIKGEDAGYQDYFMEFEDSQGWLIKFRFRKYNDIGNIYMISILRGNDWELINDYVEEDEDLAGCCKSALCYMCERV